MVSLESKDALLQLVRLGIGTSKDAKISKDIDWESVEALAEKQGVLGVVYDGIIRLAEIADVLPVTVKLRWMGKMMQGYEQRYVLYRKAVADLAAWYHAHGYRMMLLKGLACGLDWPKPVHRPYGDIDIWLFGRQSEADALMVQEFKGQGFKVDNSHHHHTVFQWQGFTVENHYDFVNVHHQKTNAELEKIFKELAFQDTSSILAHPSNIDLPSPNLHALFLMKHMVSHFAADRITLRQLLDWGFFVKAHTKEVDWTWLEDILNDYHMLDFFNCINAICVDEMGVELNVFPYVRFKPELRDRIFNDIMAPEFSEKTPMLLWKRIPFRYRRWKANEWKHELCYMESMNNSFWHGVWNHIVKPSSI